MKYVKVQYSVSLTGNGYQELTDDRLSVIRHTDMDGNTITFVEGQPVEVVIIDKNPIPPDWAI